MSEFERWRDSLGVKYPPSEQIIMEWAFKAGYEAGLRRAAEAVDAGIVRGHIDGYGLDKAAQRNGMVLAYNAILAEIKGE